MKGFIKITFLLQLGLCVVCKSAAFDANRCHYLFTLRNYSGMCL